MLENKFKTWQDGDTFALEIIDSNSEYNGKFLILNFIKRDYHLDIKYPFFRIKIIDNIDSISKEKLDNFDYVITGITNVMNSNGILDEITEENKKKTDGYGYLYEYQINILTTNRKHTIPNKLIYLGNFKLEEPKNEYIPWTPYNISLELWEDIIDKCISYYEMYNLKKSPLFDMKKAMEWYNREKEVKEYVTNYMKNFQDKENKIDNEEIKDSLTKI